MILYPVLDVYPQSILYRAFFLQRYVDLAPNGIAGRWAMILASATASSFLHIIFRNWIAVVLTFFGGILFAWRYVETGSLLTSSVEHALYGCWLFTVGLGEYFYHGVWPRPKRASILTDHRKRSERSGSTTGLRFPHGSVRSLLFC